MSMLKYLKDEIAWRNERIAIYEKRILELKAIEIPSSLALDSNDIKHLIKQQQEFISHNKNHIATYEEAIKDNEFQEIEISIKDKSNLKDIHAYLLFEAYLKLKKFKESKIDDNHYPDTVRTLKNAYNTISPYLQTSTSYTIPNSPKTIVENLYESLRVLDYSKDETKEVIALLSSVDQKRKEKPRGAKDPITKLIDPETGETKDVSNFRFVIRIE